MSLCALHQRGLKGKPHMPHPQRKKHLPIRDCLRKQTRFPQRFHISPICSHTFPVPICFSFALCSIICFHAFSLILVLMHLRVVSRSPEPTLRRRSCICSGRGVQRPRHAVAGGAEGLRRAGLGCEVSRNQTQGRVLVQVRPPPPQFNWRQRCSYWF